jgi:hypothetical protein
MDAIGPVGLLFLSGPASSNADAKMKADTGAARAETDTASEQRLPQGRGACARVSVLAWLILLNDIYGTSVGWRGAAHRRQAARHEMNVKK